MLAWLCADCTNLCCCTAAVRYAVLPHRIGAVCICLVEGPFAGFTGFALVCLRLFVVQL